MKRLSVSCAALLVLGVLSVIAAPPAAAAYTCTGFVENTTINDSVVVPAGAECVLVRSTVTGSVTVRPEADLQVRGSTINGSITADAPLRLGVITDCTFDGCPGSVVGGSVTVTGLTRRGGICGSTIRGSLTIRETAASGSWVIGEGLSGACVVLENTIRGSVNFIENEGGVDFRHATVGRSVTARDNTGGGSIENNTIGGSLNLLDNCPAWSAGGNSVKGSRNNRQCPEL